MPPGVVVPVGTVHYTERRATVARRGLSSPSSMRRITVLAVSLLLGSAPLAAQSTAAATAPATPATPAARALADTLLELMGSDRLVRASIEASFDAQVQAQPMMAQFRPTMMAWVDKYFTWNELRPHMAEIYTGAYTEDELRQLVAFYRSPVGKKTAAINPELARKGAMVGAEAAQKHLPELQKMMQAKMAELQGTNPAPPTSEP